MGKVVGIKRFAGQEKDKEAKGKGKKEGSNHENWKKRERKKGLSDQNAKESLTKNSD